VAGVYGRCSISRKTYTCTHAGFALCDQAGAILWCNRHLATAIGYKDQEVCGWVGTDACEFSLDFATSSLILLFPHVFAAARCTGVNWLGFMYVCVMYM
jgi:hypothetical protein